MAYTLVNRILFLVLSFIFGLQNVTFATTSYTSPTLYGQNGLIRVISAKSGIVNKKGFTTSYHLSYENQKKFIEVGNTDYDGLKISSILALLYSPFSFFEVSLATHGFTNLESGNSDSIQQIGNLNSSIKFAKDFGSFLSLGLLGEFYERARVPDLNIYDRIFGFDTQILASFDLLRKFNKPFIIHFNGGYKKDTSDKIVDDYNLNRYERYILDIVPYDRIIYGSGVEWLMSYISLVGEIRGEFAINATEKFYYHPFNLSAGIKIFPAINSTISFEMLGDLGIVKSADKEILPSPDIRIFLGMSYRFDYGKPIERVYEKVFVEKKVKDSSKTPTTNAKSESAVVSLPPTEAPIKEGIKAIISSESILVNGENIILPSEIRFEINSQTPTPEQIEILKQLADFLIKRQVKTLLIEGFSDSSGREMTNKDISLNRAESIKKILVLFGVTENNIKTVGLGASKPKDTNETEEGRKKNRRVEFKIKF